jgi:hypothetical protein
MSQAGHDRTIEELVERAKTYPFPRQPGSFVFTHGRLYPVPHPAGPWSPEMEIAEGDRTITFAQLCERVAAEEAPRGGAPDTQARPATTAAYACAERTPVFGYSSNASPDALSHKFAMLPHAVIPSIRCRVANWDAVFSCHVSRGYIPGAIHPSPGTELHGTMSWLTDEELELMNASESLGTNYEFRPLKGASARFETGETILSPWVYFTLHGELRINDLPVAIEGTIADNRRYGVMTEAEILELARARIAPEQDLDQMIASAVESFETQKDLTARLKDCHFTTPGGTPDPPTRHTDSPADRQDRPAA